MATKSSKTIIILSVSSDIGGYLARKYLARGWRVIGTYRRLEHCQDLLEDPRCLLLKMNVCSSKDIKGFISQLKRRSIHWDRLVCAVGSLLPATGFFDANFNAWQQSLAVNAIGPLQVVHGLYPFRKARARVVFFAGGAANNAVVNLSAYALSKIMLTKMTEFLDAEYPSLHVSIIGPGWTATKIHRNLLKHKQTASAKLRQTQRDLVARPSTDMADIDACIEWVCRQSRAVTGGRNFSVVYDPWRPDKRRALVAALKKDGNMYKLRRHNNSFLQK